MQTRRYQIFLSSTFRDLKAERQAVLDAVLSIGHFPTGMELFPASDATPWDVIARVIDDSDYYVVIVGGLYGSTDSSGISYTEREYDYAVEHNLPVLAFLHQNPSDIPAGKSEATEESRSKLEAFRKKAQRKHCKYWMNAQDLQYKVAVALVQEINTNPRTGWVRADALQLVADSRLQEQLRRASEELVAQQHQREAAERRISELEHQLSIARSDMPPGGLHGQASTSTPTARKHKAKHLQVVPRSFTPAAAREVLAGQLVRLDGFVLWEETPQGIGFWAREDEEAKKSGKTSEAAKAAINEMLQAFNAHAPKGATRAR